MFPVNVLDAKEIVLLVRVVVLEPVIAEVLDKSARAISKPPAVAPS